MGLGRGGDRVEPGLQPVEGFQQAGQRGHHRGKGLEQIEQVGLGQLRRAFALGQRLQLQRLLAVEGARRQEEHALVAGPGDVDLAQQHLAQRQGIAVEGHHLLAGGADAIEDGLHELRVLAGEDAETVARLVGEVGGRQIEHDVAHVLVGPGAIERVGVDQGGERRPVAREAERARGLRRRRHGGHSAALRLQRRHQLLHLALGFLAARHAAAHVGLGAGPHGLGVGLAEIAALAAIELGHRGHQLAGRLAVLGERQALGHGERRVVPGEILVGVRGFGGCAAFVGGGRLAVDAEIGGEEAVQPRPLLGRERRVLRNQRRNGRDGVHAASARTGALFARSRSSAISWRRQNSKNDSAGDWRCAR